MRTARGRPPHHRRYRACAQDRCHWCDCPEAYGPYTTVHNRFVRWARHGIWENLFREIAGNGRSADTQMIDSTHVKAHRLASGGKRGAEAGCRPLTGRAQHENPHTRRC
ncbi:MAG: transposase [Candidatus Saccharimonadales bacterium]